MGLVVTLPTFFFCVGCAPICVQCVFFRESILKKKVNNSRVVRKMHQMFFDFPSTILLSVPTHCFLLRVHCFFNFAICFLIYSMGSLFFNVRCLLRLFLVARCSLISALCPQQSTRRLFLVTRYSLFRTKFLASR